VIYSSNQDDIDHRHLWRVNVEGGKTRSPHPRRDERLGAITDQER
jgi:hypothetical protein